MLKNSLEFFHGITNLKMTDDNNNLFITSKNRGIYVYNTSTYENAVNPVFQQLISSDGQSLHMHLSKSGQKNIILSDGNSLKIFSIN